MDIPDVSIIIVNYNGGQIVLDCLQSIYQHLNMDSCEVIVVDNCSKDGSQEAISDQFPLVKLLRQRQNLGFGLANNAGVEVARGNFLFLLNSDTLIGDDILSFLVERLSENPGIGIIGPQLHNLDGSFQYSVSKEISIWGEFLTLQEVWQYRDFTKRPQLAQQYAQEQGVSIVVGAAMFMRRSLFVDVGGFDENFFMYFEESDLCKRVRDRGYQILYTPEVSLIHLGGYSISQTSDRMAKEYRRSQRYYYKKHRPRWEQWVLELYLNLKTSSQNMKSVFRKH
jgi:GT2 family glycosyltransferase